MYTSLWWHGMLRQATALDTNDSHYYRSTSGIFPVRWAAPEVVQHLLFSVGSDVWAWAVTVVEIFTSGDMPYAGLTLEQVMSSVKEG